MLELVNDAGTFELEHPSGAVFTLRHWTFDMQDEVDKQCLVFDEKTKKFSYQLPLERRLKLEQSLVTWRGVAVNGEEVPCTPENKRKLPVGVAVWLVNHIDERAGLRLTEAEKKS